jgi:predicted RNA-binding protein YlqC (UPF0109 family)
VTETFDPSDPISEIRTLVIEIAKALVDEPDAVNVEVIVDQDTAVLRLEVAPADVGKVIGKQGRTARSLRTILGAASMKHRRRFALDIVEADDRTAEDEDV